MPWAGAVAAATPLIQWIDPYLRDIGLNQFSLADQLGLHKYLFGVGIKEEAKVSATKQRDVTVRGTVEPMQVIYGECEVGGFIAYMATADLFTGSLFFVIAVAHHQCEAITQFRIDSTRIQPSQWASGSTFVVSHPQFIGADGLSKLKIVPHLGTNAQTVDTDLNGAVAAWDSTHTGKGVAYFVAILNADDTAFPNGAPQNFFALVKGRRLYDPRLDSTNGGSGSQRYDDATTWTYSNNAALAVRDYLTGGSICYDVATPNKKLLLGEDDTRVLDSYVITAANICDESCTVPIPVLAGTLTWTNGSPTVTGVGTSFLVTLAAGNRLLGPDSNFYTILSIASATSLTLTGNYAGSTTANAITQWHTSAVTTTTQPRYTCDIALSLAAFHRLMIESLLSSMIGAVSYVEGKYRIFAGSYTSPVETLNEEDFQGEVKVTTHPSGDNNYNYVHGTLFDEDRNWQESPYAPQTQTSYQTDDGYLYKREINLPATRTNFRCQRIANVHLKLSRQKTVVVFSRLSLKAMRIAERETFYVNLSEYGWTNQVFRCLSWKFSMLDGVEIMAVTDASSSYSDLAAGDYQLPRNVLPGAQSVMLPVAPNALTVTSYAGNIGFVVGFAATPPAGTLIQIWEHTSNSPFSSASVVARGTNVTSFLISKNDTTERFYWATATLNGQVSTNFPASTGTSGRALPALTPNALTATGIAGGITFAWGASGDQPPGTRWRLYEHTANTPFSSAVLIHETDALSWTKMGDTPSAKYYWVKALANGTLSTEYPSGNGVSGQGLAPVAPTSLVIVGFPTYIRLVVGGTFAPGTLVEVYEYTANTPFASATLIATEEANVIHVARRDTTTRYYWVRTKLSGQTSTEYPSGNGTAGAADQTQTGDIAPEAATSVTLLTDTGPDDVVVLAGNTEVNIVLYTVSISVNSGYKVEVSISFRIEYDEAGGSLELKLAKILGASVEGSPASNYTKVTTTLENGALVASFQPSTTDTYEFGLIGNLTADGSNDTTFTFRDVSLRVTVVKR